MKSRASDDPALWSALVDKKIALIKDKQYPFTMIFDCPVPTPERSISLDIGRALLHPRRPNIPTIRFMKIRWKQGYTLMTNKAIQPIIQPRLQALFKIVDTPGLARELKYFL